MSQEVCPFCKTGVNAGAEACHACGAQKGYDGAGRSKHAIGWLGLFFAALAYLGFASGESLLAFFSLLTGLIAFGLICGRLINLVTPLKWYRSGFRTPH